MTTMQEWVDRAVEATRKVKEQSAKRGEVMMRPTLLVFRGDRQIAIVVAGTEGRADVLKAARGCITGLAADVLVIAMDTYHSRLGKNPRTGQDWGNGEMQEAADKYHGRERGWVSDAISVMAINRATDMANVILPYKQVSRHRVEWTDGVLDLAKLNGGKVGGVIPDMLSAAMNEPTLAVQMMRETGVTGKDFGLNAEEEQAHTDLGVAKVLDAMGCTVAFSSTEGTVRDDILRASQHTTDL